jgi:hypothetical protein
LDHLLDVLGSVKERASCKRHGAEARAEAGSFLKVLDCLPGVKLVQGEAVDEAVPEGMAK